MSTFVYATSNSKRKVDNLSNEAEDVENFFLNSKFKTDFLYRLFIFSCIGEWLDYKLYQ